MNRLLIAALVVIALVVAIYFVKIGRASCRERV